jgi:hypothetical protein
MLIVGVIILAGGGLFALSMLLGRPKLPPPSATMTLQAASPRVHLPGELGQVLQDVHRQIVERHDAQALESLIGQAGSQLSSNPLFRSLNPTAGQAAPKPPASA